MLLAQQMNQWLMNKWSSGHIFPDKVKHDKPDQPFNQEEQEANQAYPFEP